MKRTYLAPALLVAALAAAACSDRVTSTETAFDRIEPPATETGETATYAFVQERVLTPSCAVSGCHNGAVFPDLSAAAAYDNTVEKMSSAGIPYVDPGTPASSFLYVKINGGPNLVGSQMPLRWELLSQALIDSVAAWIERGAERE